MLCYRQLFVKGNIFIGVCGIPGADIFLHYSRFFVKGNFIIGRVECTKLSQQDVEELMADINRVLRSSHPQPNLTKAQNLALRELKRDRDCIVLTVDKGVAMVIMDRQDYINKANRLLNQNTYRSIPRDPTNSINNKLISILKRVKNQTGLDSITYKSMYPTGCVPPSSMASPRSTNQRLL